MYLCVFHHETDGSEVVRSAWTDAETWEQTRELQADGYELVRIIPLDDGEY